MPNVVYLLLRRMRAPLVVLILTYAISVLGLVLIPGVDAAGHPWRMDFFHAFYFVSFMGSTIGLGEIPHPFSDAQRLWTTVAIYAAVVAWLYAIGSLLAMTQDEAFRRVVRHAAFVRAMRRMSDPFYLVCGYGDTGSLVVRALDNRGMRAVVIDIDQSRIDALEVEDYRLYVPGLCADATDVDALRDAGLTHRNCAGVLALTNDDQANVAVALAVKLISPQRKVICRAEHQDAMANLASFGTDHIVNPFETFANRFAMAIHSPSMYLIYEWMTSTSRVVPDRVLSPPRGTWVLCGFGRFGKAVHKYLSFEGIRSVVIEADPDATDPPEGAVHGRGTEAVTLREAHIEDAVGVIAGTDNDTNNLSIVITARELNPGLFAVARQNHRRNDLTFEAARLDLVMQPGTIIARTIVALITSPLLSDFLRLARHRDDDWANVLVSRISGLTRDEAPDTWVLDISPADAPAVVDALGAGQTIPMRVLARDPRERERALPGMVLLLAREGEELLVPDEDTPLRLGDRLLFCGHREARRRLAWVARNHNALSYVLTGTERPTGYLWRWIAGDR